MKEHTFEEIRSIDEAYFLGWMATSEVRPAGKISFSMHKKATSALTFFAEYVGKPVASEEGKKRVTFTFYAPSIVKSLWRVMGRGELQFPTLQDDSLTWAFLRGHLEKTGTISSLKKSLFCSMGGGKEFQNGFQKFCQIPFVVDGDELLFEGNNALDLLGNLYERGGPCLERNRERFLRWSVKISGLNDRQKLSFRWNRLTPEAQAPKKERVSDSGYDLVLLERVKTVGTTQFFRTGIQVEPPYGWYFDMVPRSSLSKTGYMMAHSVGVIDRSYRGEIFVPLIKVDPDAAELSLPARLVQLIPRPIVHFAVQEGVLGETSRGEKGFGSSGR